MRCMCRECGTYMVQANDGKMGCICPECFSRCKDCLGTDTVISRDTFKALKNDPVMAEMMFKDRNEEEDR